MKYRLKNYNNYTEQRPSVEEANSTKVADEEWFNNRWVDKYYFERDWFQKNWIDKYKLNKT